MLDSHIITFHRSVSFDTFVQIQKLNSFDILMHLVYVSLSLLQFSAATVTQLD